MATKSKRGDTLTLRCSACGLKETFRGNLLTSINRAINTGWVVNQGSNLVFCDSCSEEETHEYEAPIEEHEITEYRVA